MVRMIDAFIEEVVRWSPHLLRTPKIPTLFDTNEIHQPYTFPLPLIVRLPRRDKGQGFQLHISIPHERKTCIFRLPTVVAPVAVLIAALAWDVYSTTKAKRVSTQRVQRR